MSSPQIGDGNESRSSASESEIVSSIYDSDLYLKRLDTSLDSAKSVTSWIILTMVTILLSSFAKDDNVTLFSQSFPKQSVFLVGSAIFVYGNIYLTLLFARILWILGALHVQHWADGLKRVTCHEWILNPLSAGSSRSSIVSNSLGYPLLFLFWWASFVTLEIQNYKVKAHFGWIVIMGAGLFAFVLGLPLMLLINRCGRLMVERATESDTRKLLQGTNRLRTKLCFCAVGIGLLLAMLSPVTLTKVQQAFGIPASSHLSH